MQSRSYQIIGPPGCGKTTYVIDKASEAAEIWGSRSVMICSLTKTAAVEAKRRESPLDPEMIRTLHSFCYRALGRPTIAETKLKEWNDHIRSIRPDYVIEGQQPDTDDILEDEDEWTPDGYLQQYTLLRARMTPRELWPEAIQDFGVRWEDWKEECDYFDYEDCIERCREDVDRAPGGPQVIYVDEAQDCSASELTLCKLWGRFSSMVYVGDMDQAIYEWRGASPQMFAEIGIGENRRRVLEQSYRVPREVHAEAVMWVRKIGAGRIDAVYRPVDRDGEVRRVDFSIERPGLLLRDAKRYLDQGKSVMILAACKKFLDPLIKELRSQGIPFHNPFRIKSGKWNPLAKRRGVSMADRIAAFIQPQERDYWTAEALYKWLDLVKQDGLLIRGSKARIKKMAVDAPGLAVDDETLVGLFEEGKALEAIEAGWNGDVGWLKNYVLAKKVKTLDYPLKVFERSGIEALRMTPQVIIGTIHSTKGGEADVVYLGTDISMPAFDRYVNTDDPNGRNEIIRQFYVGMTRAKESLILCAAKRGAPCVDL